MAEAPTGKLFIGGISWSTTTETLLAHYRQFGEVTDGIIMMDRSTGRPRGFGFVTYQDPEVAARVAQQSHTIDGRTVDTKIAVNRDSAPAPMPRMPEGRINKLFVGGISQESTEESLSAYFSQYGILDDVTIMTDPVTGNTRGFGFVTFNCADNADVALNAGRMQTVDGKMVELKRAQPRGARGGGKGKGGGKGGIQHYQGGYGGGYQQRGAYQAGFQQHGFQQQGYQQGFGSQQYGVFGGKGSNSSQYGAQGGVYAHAYGAQAAQTAQAVGYGYGQGGSGSQYQMAPTSFGYGQGGVGGYAVHHQGQPMYAAPVGGDTEATRAARSVADDAPTAAEVPSEATAVAAGASSSQDVLAAIAAVHGQQQGFAPEGTLH